MTEIYFVSKITDSILLYSSVSEKKILHHSRSSSKGNKAFVQVWTFTNLTRALDSAHYTEYTQVLPHFSNSLNKSIWSIHVKPDLKLLG